MREGYFDSAVALEKLEAAKENPVSIGETWIILGMFDPGVRMLKTDLRYLLKPYISDLSKVRLETNALSAFRNLSIDDLAIKFINNLRRAYESSIEDVIRINIVAHSMGAAIATRAITLLSQLQLSKRYIVESFLSLNGAIQGGGKKLTSLGSAVACCCNKNPMRDLMPSNSANRSQRLHHVRATYMSSKLDKIVPTVCAAPAGCPVVVLETCRMSAHTDILSRAVPLAYVLSL